MAEKEWTTEEAQMAKVILDQLPGCFGTCWKPEQDDGDICQIPDAAVSDPPKVGRICPFIPQCREICDYWKNHADVNFESGKEVERTRIKRLLQTG